MANYDVVLGRCEISCNEMEHGVELGGGRSRSASRGLLFWAVAQKHLGWDCVAGTDGRMAAELRSRAICKASLARDDGSDKIGAAIHPCLVYDKSFKHQASICIWYATE